jgi:hypothetical protein
MGRWAGPLQANLEQGTRLHGELVDPAQNPLGSDHCTL